MTQARPTERSAHAELLSIVHQEARRTLSRADFDLCMRVAERAAALRLTEDAISMTVPDAVEALRAALLDKNTLALGAVLGLVSLIRSRNLAGKVCSHTWIYKARNAFDLGEAVCAHCGASAQSQGGVTAQDFGAALHSFRCTVPDCICGGGGGQFDHHYQRGL